MSSLISSARQGKRRQAGARVVDTPRSENLAEQAYRGLRSLILERKISPGSLVVEGRLVDELRMSRTPVREALVRLIGEGLLERADARSYSVRKVTPTEFFQSMQVRETLETHAMDLAVGKVPADEIDALARDIRRLAKETEQEALHWHADDRLHLMFARASGNAVLFKMIETLRVNTRLFEISGAFGRVAKDGAEHLAILAAWRKDDVKAAKKALLAHLRNLQDEALEVVAGRRSA
jgi:GntR family transcriptional regulator, rspAB operon transcriptional repressor